MSNLITVLLKQFFIHKNSQFIFYICSRIIFCMCSRIIFTTFVTRSAFFYFHGLILPVFIQFDYIIMAASTSTAVPFAVLDDVSRLRAVVDRSTKEVKDYTSQYEY